ncbi:MAG: CRISPR-associated endonuclease Cas1 [Clostridiales bacterium]|nr:CRISPR-associated endonuclease Cas1 [Clostridiales bacterium]
MGTLYIDRKDLELRVDGKAIALYLGNKREGVVPLGPLKRVIIVGNVRLNASVLHKLASYNISALFLSGKRLRFAGILHGRLHRNGLIRLKQYEKIHTPFALITAVELIEKKLEKQKEFLIERAEQRNDIKHDLLRAVRTIDEIIRQVRQHPNLNSLRGLEGSAANAYYRAFSLLFAPSLGFHARVRRPPTDPVNAMLSLTYTFLHFEMVREIECIGLDPVIGYYHTFEYGRESLACDLVEPFRPNVDCFVYSIFKGEQLRTSDFAKENSNNSCYLKKKSRKKYFFLYESWAQSQRELWQDEVRKLARRIADGADSLFD